MGETAHRPGGHWLTYQSIDKLQDRIYWEDGTFSDYTLLRFPSAGFRFLDIDQQEPQVKLKDAAYLRWVKAIARGEAAPRIVAFLRLERDRPVSELFPDLHCHTESGEELLSANSLITHTLRTLLSRGWLRYERGRWQVTAPSREAAWRQRGEAVLGLLEREGRLRLELGPGVRPPGAVDFEDFAVRLNLIPVGRLAFPRDLVWRERPRIAFNTAFFLLEHNDFFSFHSALGEPYGLFVQDGGIRRPPLYRRGTIFQRANGQWQTGRFSLKDVSFVLPDGTMLASESHLPHRATGGRVLPFALNASVRRPSANAKVTAYTRLYGTASQGRVVGRTPIEGGRVELTIIDQRVVGWKAGGGLDIPQNGFVLSFAQGLLTPEAQAALRARPVVSYRFMREEHRDIVQALQVGPLLLRGGRSVITPTRLAEEEFWVDRPGDDGRMQIGVVPTEFPDDVDKTRAGRIGLGVDREGKLVVVGIAGVEKGAKHLEADSHGATLAELADLLADAGAVEAVNLDGGGSTQIFFLGGLATVAGGRLGLPGVHYERMVPSVGVLL
jgi:hypothetical protein